MQIRITGDKIWNHWVPEQNEVVTVELEEEEVEVEAAVEEELGLEDLAGAEAQILLRVGYNG